MYGDIWTLLGVETDQQARVRLRATTRDDHGSEVYAVRRHLGENLLGCLDIRQRTERRVIICKMDDIRTMPFAAKGIRQVIEGAIRARLVFAPWVRVQLRAQHVVQQHIP